MFAIKNQIVTIEKKDIISIKKLIDIFKGSAIFTREDKFYYFFRTVFGLDDFENKKYYKNCADYLKGIKEYAKKGIINEEDVNFLDADCSNFRVVFAYKEIVDGIIEKYFKIKSIKQSFAHPVLTCYKIYFGEVRK